MPDMTMPWFKGKLGHGSLAKKPKEPQKAAKGSGMYELEPKWLWMYVCMRACMYVQYVLQYVCMYACMYACMYVYMYVCK